MEKVSKTKKTTKFNLNKYLIWGGLVGDIIVIILLCLLLIPKGERTSELDYNYEIYRSNLDLHYYKVKDSLVCNINEYIQKQSNGKSSLDGLKLLEACDKYNMDIKFVLVQGQQESNFGTQGVAAKTNSVFNVHSYDNKSWVDIVKEGKGYSHPNESVEPYLELLRRRYLVDGKTEYDLLINFVDKNGNRYASAKNYEQSLMNSYNNVDNIVPISDIYKEYLKYKIILNK